MSANLPNKGMTFPNCIAFIGHPCCAGGYFFTHKWVFGQQASLLSCASRAVYQQFRTKVSRLVSGRRLFNYLNPKEMPQ